MAKIMTMSFDLADNFLDEPGDVFPVWNTPLDAVSRLILAVERDDVSADIASAAGNFSATL